MITRPKLWLTISSLTMLVAIVVIVAIGPAWGIDFQGGSLLEIKSATLAFNEVNDIVADSVGSSSTTQATGEGTFLVRTDHMDQAKRQQTLDRLRTKDGKVEILRFETIGPTIGAELRRKAWIAVALSVAATIGYLAYEFRHTGSLIRSWKYGAAAGVALVHDTLVVTAVFVVLGKVASVPIDALFVTAMLALAGYSVNDTIVLFNRFKHEWLSARQEDLMTVMDRSVKLTLIRSFNTSITIMLTLLTLLFFGGPTIRWFIVALVVGTVVGTYSTIFVAPPFLNLFAQRR